jgi:RHS repeat-associated protein
MAAQTLCWRADHQHRSCARWVRRAHTQELLRYGYDAAGRLRAMQQGEQQLRWDVDPAGNRLPAPTRPGQASEAFSQASWAAQVHAHWRQQHFNVLGQGQSSAASQPATITHWPHNRIGYSDKAAWRYDACGNRREQLQSQGQRQVLGYDGAHQLVRLELEAPAMGQPTAVGSSISRYVYDALGRRLKKALEESESSHSSHSSQNSHSNQNIQNIYYGWDGDRLVHTERIDAEHPGQRQITHTVYEPESFTPLLRLSTATKQQGKPNALVQALGAGLQDGDEDDHQALVMMQAMLGAMPKDLQDSAQASMQQALQQGLPPSALAAMPDEGKNTLQRLSDLREQLEKQEQSEQTPIEVLYFHCDHLGTPLALTDPSRNIVWAAQLDPWGNVLQEFNPQNIEQPIRLPGQHHDRETGLYYNRHRYYDPSIGSYINQDPIGLAGGANLHRYPDDPTQLTDPLGLQATISPLASFKEDWATVPRSDGTPLGYGCGDQSTDNFVPDRPLGFNFLPACRSHDICYGSKNGPTKSECDQQFKRNMEKECSNYSWVKKQACQGIANDYYKAVDWFGNEAFKNARK